MGEIRTAVSDTASLTADTEVVTDMADTVVVTEVVTDMVDMVVVTDMADTGVVTAMEVGMADTEGTVTEARSTLCTKPSTPSTTTCTRPTPLARGTSRLASTT